jgi:hypothetical protein
MPNHRDWLNVGAIVPLLVVLFGYSFGLCEAPIMSLQAEVLWITGIIVIASLVWLNAAKMAQREREAKEHERKVTITLDNIKNLLSKPDTTVEDIRMAATGIKGPLSNTPLASSDAQAKIHQWWDLK